MYIAYLVTTGTQCVHCAVRNTSLNTIRHNFRLESPSNVSAGYPPTSHNVRPCSILGQWKWDLWWKKRHLDPFFWRYIRLPCPYNPTDAPYSYSYTFYFQQKCKLKKPGSLRKAILFRKSGAFGREVLSLFSWKG